MPADEQIITAVTEVLAECFPDSTVRADTQLIDEGVFDSLGLMELIEVLEDRFGIVVDNDQLDLETFQTPITIAAMVGAKLPVSP